MNKFKCAVMSDTHQQHEYVDVPNDIDILFHAGDFCSWGTESEAVSFIEWWHRQPGRYKVLIAGNHDKCFDTNFVSQDVRDRLINLARSQPNCFYLEGDTIEIEGIKIYGGPWQPEFGGWAFNLKRGHELRNKWNLIPEDVSVVVTHGPPQGKLDLIHPQWTRPNESPNVGCRDLMEAISRVKPRYHLFGHIHPQTGRFLGKDTEFINAAIVSDYHKVVNMPQEFWL